MLVNETVLISEQITEYRFGALLGISEKFSTKTDVFSSMILQCWRTIWNVSSQYCMTLKNTG